MNETTRPMSAGRAPTQVGIVSIVADGGIYPTTITNREVYFPSYPTEAKGYISEGYGLDLTIPTSSTAYFNGNVGLATDGEDVRIVDIPLVAYYEYHTPRFIADVSQGDVVHKPWIGVTIKLSCERTTTVDDYSTSPPVITITTETVEFSHTFSTADDPMVGSPDYIYPNQSRRLLLGVEYLYLAYENLKTTTTTQTPWKVVETTPP